MNDVPRAPGEGSPRRIVLAVAVAAAASALAVCRQPAAPAGGDAGVALARADTALAQASPDAGTAATEAPVRDAMPDAIPDAAPDAQDDAMVDQDAAVDAGPRRTTEFEEEVRGTVMTIGGEPLVDVTVRLTCERNHRPEDDHPLQRQHREREYLEGCEATLSVLKDGVVIAQGEAPAIESLGLPILQAQTLRLLTLEPESGAALIVIEFEDQEFIYGEPTRDDDTDILFAVAGDEVAEVLRVNRREGLGRAATVTDLEPGKRRTNGVRNLIATERSARSKRQLKVTTFVWTGDKYRDKKELSPANEGR
jgi:hypothetical protein